jgi:RNA polymerase sigma-70 factor (ECF subfamily)
MQCKSDGLKQPGDEELFRRMKAGDQAALQMLYERYEAPLYRYAASMSGNRALAEEVTQEAFVQLISASARFDERRGSLEAYLYGVVRNLLRRARTADAGEMDDVAAAEDLLGALIKDETVAGLYRAVRELPAGYREAIVLCDLEEQSYEHAAELMGCPVGTVRSRVHRGRAILAEKLKHHRRARQTRAGRVIA